MKWILLRTLRKVPTFTIIASAAVALQGSLAQASERCDRTELSGTFHLNDKDPGKHLALRGKTGIVKINNIGPAGLVVRNSRNRVTLGANTRMELVFEGDTDLSVSRDDRTHRTDGSFEVSFN